MGRKREREEKKTYLSAVVVRRHIQTEEKQEHARLSLRSCGSVLLFMPSVCICVCLSVSVCQVLCAVFRGKSGGGTAPCAPGASGFVAPPLRAGTGAHTEPHLGRRENTE